MGRGCVSRVAARPGWFSAREAGRGMLTRWRGWRGAVRLRSAAKDPRDHGYRRAVVVGACGFPGRTRVAGWGVALLFSLPGKACGRRRVRPEGRHAVALGVPPVSPTAGRRFRA